jgi:hypothetical protein
MWPHHYVFFCRSRKERIHATPISGYEAAVLLHATGHHTLLIKQILAKFITVRNSPSVTFEGAERDKTTLYITDHYLGNCKPSRTRLYIIWSGSQVTHKKHMAFCLKQVLDGDGSRTRNFYSIIKTSYWAPRIAFNYLYPHYFYLRMYHLCSRTAFICVIQKTIQML